MSVVKMVLATERRLAKMQLPFDRGSPPPTPSQDLQLLVKRQACRTTKKGRHPAANPLGDHGGRYWDRTSDLRRVKTAL